MTTTETPAAIITRAAARLRQLAEHATHEDRPVWMFGYTMRSRTPVVLDHPDKPSVLIETYAANLEAVNRYIAAMDPAVGLALAAWLESWTGIELNEHGPMPEDAQHALAVARQILGEA